MRLLLTLPHFYRPAADSGANHGSVRADPRPRIAALTASLSSLRTLYGTHTSLLDHRQPPKIVPANKPDSVLDIVICTTGDYHLLEQIPAAAGEFEHRSTNAEPMQLGYECHAVLKERLGNYDYYGYLEDDLIATDPWMFLKLAWFNRMAGDDALLQPNRFELGFRNGVNTRKLYVDGPINPRHADQFQNRSELPRLTGQILGVQVQFERPMNPHSGCFFLNAQQMASWASKPYFLDRSAAFYAPLESAATLGIIRAFRVYKSVSPFLDFLEIQHSGTGYLGLLNSAPSAPTPTANPR